MKAGTPGQNEAYCFLPTNQEEEKPLSPTEPLCQELTDLAIGLQDAPFILLVSARPRPAPRSKTLLISLDIFQVPPVCQELRMQR